MVVAGRGKCTGGSLDFAAVVKPVGAVHVDDLDLGRFGVDALNGVGMVADDVWLAEEHEGTGEKIVEIWRHDQSSQFFFAEQMSEAEIGVGNGLFLDQFL